MTTTEIQPDTGEEARRAAVCAAVAWAPRLVRYAARYSLAPDDAEDAYQRAMEIALRRAPVGPDDHLLRWLHVVVRHEALAIARLRRREAATGPEELEGVRARGGPEQLAEWRERHRQLRDALDTLTDAERTCVALHGAGLSYAEIVERTGFSPRKVERSLLEGRRRLHAWEIRLREGKECTGLGTTLTRVVEGDASARDRRRVDRHVGHCGSCRAELRRLRGSRALLASLVPAVLLAGTAAGAQPPDPGVLAGAWDRISGASAVRVTALWQHLLDAPGPALAKAGASAAAAAVLVGAATGLTRGPGGEALVPAAQVAAADVPAIPRAVPARPRRHLPTHGRTVVTPRRSTEHGSPPERPVARPVVRPVVRPAPVRAPAPSPATATRTVSAPAPRPQTPARAGSAAVPRAATSGSAAAEFGP